MPAFRPLWGLLTRRNDPFATASELYGRLVAQARTPAFYADLGVPDTPEGRLELLMAHVVLMLRRLGRETGGTELARTLNEVFVTDVDDNLREMGVSDIAVPRKVKKAAAALYDRTRDYGQALDAADITAIARVVGHHLLVSTADPTADGRQANAIAAYLLESERRLAAGSIVDALAANPFPNPTAA